ncbi:hypothetical protein D3C80_1118930 [compost metagenome]
MQLRQRWLDGAPHRQRVVPLQQTSLARTGELRAGFGQLVGSDPQCCGVAIEEIAGVLVVVRITG